MTEEQSEARAWSEAIAIAKDAEAFNLLLKLGRERKYGKTLMSMLMQPTKDAGLVFDKDTKLYVSAKVEVAA
jgi:hypothetical protein